MQGKNEEHEYKVKPLMKQNTKMREKIEDAGKQILRPDAHGNMRLRSDEELHSI